MVIDWPQLGDEKEVQPTASMNGPAGAWLAGRGGGGGRGWRGPVVEARAFRWETPELFWHLMVRAEAGTAPHRSRAISTEGPWGSSFFP